MIGTLLGIGAATLLGGIIGAASDDKNNKNNKEEFNNNLPEFDEDRWNKLIEKIKTSLDNEQYEKADSQLGDYYRQFENNEKDYWFYYFRTCILLRKLEETGIEHGGLKQSIKEAIKLVPDDEHLQEMNELQERYEDALINPQNNKEAQVIDTDDNPKMIALKDCINTIARDSSLEVIDDCGSMSKIYEDALEYLSDEEKYFCSNAFYANLIENGAWGWFDDWNIDGWDKEDDVFSYKILILSARGILFHKVLVNNKFSPSHYSTVEEWKTEWEAIKRFVCRGMNSEELRFETNTRNESEQILPIDGKVWKPIFDRILSLVSTPINSLDTTPISIQNVNSNSGIKQSSNSVETTAETAIIESNDPSSSYRKEVLFVLQDGAIGATERKLLEKKRKRLGLTEEQAREIEYSCSTPSMSEAELEYADTYKDLVEDGEPTGRLRKLLNREAEALGLSPEQVAKVEQMIK